MPIYRYDSTSLIDEITIIKNASGGARAYLHARDGATSEQLSNAVRQLTDSRYLVVPIEIDGKPMLEVRGFGKADTLQRRLGSLGLTGKVSEQEAIKEDKIPFIDKLKKRTLLASSLTYLISDYGYFRYGQLKQKKDSGHWEDKIAGIFYNLGSWFGFASMLLRRDQSETEIRKASEVAIKAAQQSGIAINETDSLLYASKDHSKRSALVTTFAKYPSELMNISFGTAGALIAKGARKDYIKLRNAEKDNPELKRKLTKAEKENPAFNEINAHQKEVLISKQDIFLGLTSTVSGLIGSVIPEKHPDPDAPKPTGLRAIGSWIQQRPLVIAASGLLVSTGVHVKSSLDERKKAKAKGESLEASNWRLWFVMGNLVAELLMAFSSKGHGKGVKSDTSIDPTTCALAAEMIYKRPEEQRAELIEKMAGFLAKPDALNVPREKLAAMIGEQLAQLEKNPWAAAMPQPLILEQEPALAVAGSTEPMPDKATRPPLESHQHEKLAVEGIPVHRNISPSVAAESLPEKMAKIAAAREKSAQNFTERLGRPNQGDWRQKSMPDDIPADASYQAIGA